MSSRTATRSRSSSWEAMIPLAWSSEYVVRYTSRFFARSIGSVGSPCIRPLKTWKRKKSLRTARWRL